MAFLPQTARERKILAGLVLFLIYLGIEIWMGAKYAEWRDSDFRAFVWDSQTFWSLKPGFRGKTYGAQVYINSSGFRGTEEYPLQSKHALRVIAIGDSRTYGYAVENDETFSHVLQSTLRERGVDAEVMNAGTHGYTAVQSRAKLEELLPYKPNIVIFAPGYNDRRYLLLTPPDDPASYKKIVFMRRIVDALNWSNVFFGLTFELGQRKLKSILKNPPGLDEVKVRVDVEPFRREMERAVEICRENNIRLFFLRIPQNPNVFEQVEEGVRRLEAGQPQEALALLDAICGDLHVAARPFCHYVSGQAYRAMGDEENAQRHFKDHQPLGSLHGEAILRSQVPYFQVYEDLSQTRGIPLVDAREALYKVNNHIEDPVIQSVLDEMEEYNLALVDGRPNRPRENGKVVDLENFFQARFSDECHFDKAGEKLLGMALADAIVGDGTK